jgi:2-polyprenyl-3-methyl-5-hydroxy-6-metoxy-1,4-benzoquinol methylase
VTEAVLNGDAHVYTKPVLAIYDPIALGIVCPVAWHCSRRVMLEHYDRNIRNRHLDIGPGTGYFLDKCRFPTSSPSIVIADLNETVLETVSNRIARYAPEALVRDAMHPLDLGERRFESVGIMNIIHCLPGTMAQKTAVFDNVRDHVEPGGRIFGSTVLSKGVGNGPFASWLMRQYNKVGTFQNTDDSLEQLDIELSRRFADYRIRVKGSMALFEAHV